MNTSARTSTTRSRGAGSLQNLWFPGFLERMACCAMPPQNMNDLVVVGDSQDDYYDDDGRDNYDYSISDDDDSQPEEEDHPVMVLESSTRQPISQQPPPLSNSRRQPRRTMTGNPDSDNTKQLHHVDGSSSSLPSPTFSPSRRDLDRWDPSRYYVAGVVPACCSPSCAGSTATTASTMSEEEGYYEVAYNGNTDNTQNEQEEIWSNATTQVVSHGKHRNNPNDKHKNHNHRRNELLASTLASAEQRLRQQLLEEEARAEYLKARRQRRVGR